MLTLTPIAVENEFGVAQRLLANIRKAWPTVEADPDDRIDILVGVRTPTDVDILVLLDLAEPKTVPALRRRDGSHSTPRFVQHAILAIEVKQLDGSRFTAVGDQLFPDYRGDGKRRSVSQQASSGAYGLKGMRGRAGFREPFIHALAWLTEVDEAMLAAIEPFVLGRGAGWFEMLDASAQQNGSIYLVGRTQAAAGIRALRNLLLNRRAITSRDRARTEQLASEAASHHIDGLAPQAGQKQIRLFGHGGTGKTTTLALLAKRLALSYERRVLMLTFHRTLRADIEHLVSTLTQSDTGGRERIRVATATSFLLDALGALGGTIPMTNAGGIDYARLQDAFEETRQLLIGGPESGDAAALRAREPERFDWDHILIDEAQDWRDTERDFLRALYGHKRIAIADGLEQLALRPTRCSWTAGIPKDECAERELTLALRMMRNPAVFADAVAAQHPGGLADWRVKPNAGLPGGRIVIATGEIDDVSGFMSSLATAARAGGADPLDCLICVPPRDGVSTIADAIATAGLPCWDASNSSARDAAPDSAETWRVVPYDSCRGLEGWITVVIDLDAFYSRRIDRPHVQPGEGGSPQLVASRWLMTVLTRAVHTLIVTLRNPDSELAAILRAASTHMPKGVVEWVDAADCATRLAPPASGQSREESERLHAEKNR